MKYEHEIDPFVDVAFRFEKNSKIPLGYFFNSFYGRMNIAEWRLFVLERFSFVFRWISESIKVIIVLNGTKVGCVFRWSFYPNPACGSIETTTIGKMHPSLLSLLHIRISIAQNRNKPTVQKDNPDCNFDR